MERDSWTTWPSREALARQGVSPARRWSGLAGRYVALAIALWVTFADSGLRGDHVWIVAGASAVGVLALTGFVHWSPRRQILPCVLWLALVLGSSMVALHFGGQGIAVLLLCAIAMGSIQRLPPVVGISVTAISSVLYILLLPESGWWGNLGPVVGLGALGYVGRLDRESRAGTLRLLEQERAARTAEAESAALAERARIAREIHDVLAHSLSAQLVHLEAARLMLDAGADRALLRERIVDARRMAQDGLAETRAALSALRGEFVPVGEFLAALAEAQGARLRIEGLPRPLGAEAGVAVRRTAQEALTNIRKHAPGAETEIRLSYLDGTVELEVRNGAAVGSDPALSSSGSGYGLLGMRERAELLGGSLQAGPEAEGFRVLLRVPTP